MSANDPNLSPVLVQVQAGPTSSLDQLNASLQQFTSRLEAALKQLPNFSTQMKKAAKDMQAVIGAADGGMGYDLRLARQRFVGSQGMGYYNAGVENAKANVRQQYSRAEKSAQFNNFFELASQKQKLTEQFVRDQLDNGSFKQMERAFQARLNQLNNTPNSASEARRVKEKLEYIRQINKETREQLRLEREAQRNAARPFSAPYSQMREQLGANYLNNPVQKKGLQENIDRTFANQVRGGARQAEINKILNDPKQLYAAPTAKSMLDTQDLSAKQVAKQLNQVRLQQEALNAKRAEAILGGDTKTLKKVTNLTTALNAQETVLRNLAKQYGQLDTQKTKTNKTLNDEIQLNRLRQKVTDFDNRRYANQKLPKDLSTQTPEQLAQRSRDLTKDLAALEKQRFNAMQVGDTKRADQAARYYDNLNKQKQAIDNLVKSEKQRAQEQQRVQNTLNRLSGGTYRDTDLTAQIKGTKNLVDLDQTRLKIRRDMASAEKLHAAATKAGDQQQITRAQNLIDMYSRERAALNETQRSLAGKNSFQERMKNLMSNEGQAGLFGIQATLMKNYLMMNTVASAFSGGYAFLRDFEASLKQTQAISQATSEQMQGLRASIIEVSDASRFSAIELSDATTVLAQAGFSVKEIQTTLASVATLATATGSSLSDSVDIATSVLAAFNLAAENMPEIANQITQAMNLSKLDVPKFMLATQYAANAASDLGVSFREMLASVAAVSNTGIRSGSTMGTGMRQLMADLTTPTEKFQAVLQNLGLTLSDIDVRANGLTGVIKNLQQAGFTTSDAFESFELRATAFYVALANNIDSYDDLYSSMDSTTAAADAQKVQMNSLAAQTDRATNQFKIMADTAGGPLRSALTATLEGIADMTAALNDLLQNGFVGFLLKAALMTAGLWAMFAVIKNVLTIGATLVGWLGATATAATAATAGTTGLAASLTTLMAAAGPLRLFALAGALTAVVLAANGTESQIERLRKQLERAQTDLNTTKDNVTNLGNSFSEVDEKLKSLSSRSDALAKDQNALGVEFDVVLKKATDLGINLKTELGGSIDSLTTAWLELRAELGKQLEVDLSNIINQLGIVQQQKDNLFYQERKAQGDKPFQTRKWGVPVNNGLLDIYDPLNPERQILTGAKGVVAVRGSSGLSPENAPTSAYADPKLVGTYQDFMGQLNYLLVRSGTTPEQNTEFSQAFKRTSSLTELDPATLSPEKQSLIYDQLQEDYNVLMAYRQKILKLLAEQEKKFRDDREMRNRIGKTRESVEKIFSDEKVGLSSIYGYWQGREQNARLVRSATQKRAAQLKTNEYTGLRQKDADNLRNYEQYAEPLDQKTLNAMANSDYDRYFKKYGQASEVDPALLKAVGFRESGFNPKANSGKAYGLMQFIPETASQYNLKDRGNAEQSIEAGAKFLKDLLQRYDNNIPLALAAYNAGPGNVDKYKGIPPFKETQAYVRRVMSSYLNYSGGVPLGRVAVRPEEVSQGEDTHLTGLRSRAAFYEEQIRKFERDLNEARAAKDQDKITTLQGQIAAARKEKSDLDNNISGRLKILQGQATTDNEKEMVELQIKQLELQGQRLDLEIEFNSLQDKDKQRKLEILAAQDKLNQQELAYKVETEKRQKGKFSGPSYALSLTDKEAIQVELQTSMEGKKIAAQYAKDKASAEKAYSDYIKTQYEERTKAAAKAEKDTTDDLEKELKNRADATDSFIAYTKEQLNRPVERLKAERKNMDRADRANQYTDMDRENMDRRIAKMEAESSTTAEILELQERIKALTDNNEIYAQRLVELRNLAVQVGAERTEILEQASGDVLDSQYVAINSRYDQIIDKIKDLSATLQNSQIELEKTQFTLDSVSTTTPSKPNFAAQIQENYRNRYEDMTSARGQMENIQSVVEATRTGLVGVVEDLASASDGIDDFYKHIIDWSDETQEAFRSMGYSIVQTMMKIMLDRWTTQFMEFLGGKIAGMSQSGGMLGSIMGAVSTGLGALMGGGLGFGASAASTAASEGANNMLGNAFSGAARYSTGGQIRGSLPNRDSVPIIGKPGEWVLPTSTVDYVGNDFLNGLKNDPAATMKSLTKPVMMGSKDNHQEVSVYVVSPDSAPAAPGPNDIVVAIAKDIERGGVVKQMIKKVVQRG